MTTTGRGQDRYGGFVCGVACSVWVFIALDAAVAGHVFFPIASLALVGCMAWDGLRK